jgi:WD repeat and SOF domain-containing protein 1
MDSTVSLVEGQPCHVYGVRPSPPHRAINVHKDHVSAVLTLDYSPTGREIVTGSYDKSIRIFGFDHGHSREVYHTKRMQVRTRDWLGLLR